MAEEPILAFKLSRPTKFHCSACPDVRDQGAFVITGEVSEMIAAFQQHVARYHKPDQTAKKVTTK
jgi:hypothetical protein